MKPTTSSAFKCFKCLVFFYLILNCILGLAIAVFASYLLLFRYGGHITTQKTIVLYFLVVPPVLTILSTIIGWVAIKKKSTRLLKFFAILLALTALLEIAGSLWAFIVLPKINEDVGQHMEGRFTAMKNNESDDTWWSSVQTSLKCCGLNGPTDYHSRKSVPISCCGSNQEDGSTGSCSFLWQKGCSSALSKELSKDVITLSLLALIIAFIQMPGVFISWCFANRLSRERI